jgi:hypothetical protein
MWRPTRASPPSADREPSRTDRDVKGASALVAEVGEDEPEESASVVTFGCFQGRSRPRLAPLSLYVEKPTVLSKMLLCRRVFVPLAIFGDTSRGGVGSTAIMTTNQA